MYKNLIYKVLIIKFIYSLYKVFVEKWTFKPGFSRIKIIY